MRSLRAAAGFLVLVPLITFAQTQVNEELRAQIRADLMQDPRTAQMSQVELEGLMSALAARAQEDGTADAYLESHDTFDYSSLFPEPKAPSPIASFLASPLALAILALLIILLAVAFYIIKRRGVPAEMPSDIAA